jgi:hypothetical protein
MGTRSPQRKQFLTDLLITAIEHGGYGFPEAHEYEPDGDDPHAVIVDRYDEPGDDDALKPTRIDLDTMAKGLRILNESTTNPADWVKELMLASRTNGDDGDYDVIGALAVLECAVYGKVIYG